MTGDAHHITDPHMEGAMRCIQSALEDAGISPAEIDYVNPHATATPVGDRNEAQALQQIFKDSDLPPVGERHQVHDRPPPGRRRRGGGHFLHPGHQATASSPPPST